MHENADNPGLCDMDYSMLVFPDYIKVYIMYFG
jgi:hypothetical protein